MIKLINDIRKDLVTESASLSNTLRKAKILAHQLGLSELHQWADSELSGYEDRDQTPEYRWFRPNNLGTFFGPFGSGVKNQLLPTNNLPEPLKSFAENLILQQSVSHLEAMMSQESARFPWPAEFVEVARKYIVIEGMQLVEVNQPIPRSVFSEVLDSVKTRLLDFVLDISVTDEELRDGTFDLPQIRNTFNTHVYGDRNVVAVGENVSQELTSEIVPGNRQALLAHLSKKGIADDDLDILKNALASEPTADKNRLGPQVSAWLGRMVIKMTSGTLNVAAQAAPDILVGAIGKYYGW